MAVRKSDGRYLVEFELKGHRVFRRFPVGSTKEQATEFETRRRREIIDQVILGKRPNVTLEYAINAWLAEKVAGRKSEKGTKGHAAAVIRAVSGLRGTAQYIRSLHEAAEPLGLDGLSNGTINRRLCILKAVAKFAWKKGWTAENLSGKIELLPEKKYQRREVSWDDARKLIETANTPRAKALIACSAYTGMRLGEVLKLQPEDARDGLIRVRDTKNGSDRVIPILPELEPHLAQLPFSSGWRNIYRGFLSARRRAKLTLRYHDLRHLVGSALARSGADLRLSMDLMGHKSIETHRRYVHTDLEAKREALRRAVPIEIPSGRGKRAKKAA